MGNNIDDIEKCASGEGCHVCGGSGVITVNNNKTLTCLACLLANAHDQSALHKYAMGAARGGEINYEEMYLVDRAAGENDGVELKYRTNDSFKFNMVGFNLTDETKEAAKKIQLDLGHEFNNQKGTQLGVSFTDTQKRLIQHKVITEKAEELVDQYSKLGGIAKVSVDKNIKAGLFDELIEFMESIDEKL